MDGSVVSAGRLHLIENIGRTKHGGNSGYPQAGLFLIVLLLFISRCALAQSLDGAEDMSGEFTTAASLLKTFDTIIFGWGSPLVGAIFLFWSTWALVQQKVVTFLIALVAAILILIVPKFIKDLRELNDGTIFTGGLMATSEAFYG